MPKRIGFAILLAVGALSLVAAGCGGDDDEGDAGEGAVEIELSEQNDSGQSGTATLAAAGEGQTTVTLELSNPPDVPQPVHIHEGTCAEIDPQPAFPLENLEDGTSETTVDISVEELQSGEYAINAHASEEDVETYVACGDVS
ncbi:MAG: CHRD domain-containing protein [Gaiellaceae bacterium]